MQKTVRVLVNEVLDELKQSGHGNCWLSRFLRQYLAEKLSPKKTAAVEYRISEWAAKSHRKKLVGHATPRHIG